VTFAGAMLQAASVSVFGLQDAQGLLE